jgi:hypothetical protein
MPLNIPTVTTSKMSFGPALVYLGPAGTTPLSDVGSIGDDGVELEVTSNIIDIIQGNPGNVVQRFITQQDAFLRFNSIEWNVNQIGYTLGTGSTTISASSEKIQFGGDPCPTNVALYLQHRKACVAHTVFVRFWTATPETGSFQVKFTRDAVQGHAHAFKAIRSSTNWAGSSLAANSQLIEIEVQLQ